jgi:hypothetical protein
VRSVLNRIVVNRALLGVPTDAEIEADVQNRLEHNFLRKAMNRWMMTCVPAFWLCVPLASAPWAAEERRPVPVPAWSAFDGRHWGDLVLGATTRAAFEAKYASSPTDRDGVLQATTPKRTRAQIFLVFDGPGGDARLAWIVCFYVDARRAPQPAELVGYTDWHELDGGALTRRAGWRIFAAPERGLAVVAEPRKDDYVVSTLIMGSPKRVTDVVGRLGPAPPLGSPRSRDDARTPLRAPIGEPEVEIQVAPTVDVDRNRLQSAVTQAVVNKIRDWPVLSVIEGSVGRLAAALEAGPGGPGDENRLTLTARVSLDSESGGIAIHARSPVDRSTIDAAGGDSRIKDEARRLIERGIDAVAGDAEEQLRRRQAQLISTAQPQIRPALLDFLAGAVR